MTAKLANFLRLSRDGMLAQNTPETVTEAIRSAITGRGTGEPFFVNVEPLEGCLHMKCYGNVENSIRRNGGKKVNGWIVYEGGGGLYLKLIHHAIWERPDGTLTDPTPSDERINLFLPDSRPSAEGLSQYVALLPGPQVLEVIRFCEGSDADFRAAVNRLQGTGNPAGPGHVGRNEPCPCGSGKKYKRCHGSQIGGAR